MLSAGGRWSEKYPFLRLDIPYIIGIIACNAGFLCTEWTLPVMVIAGCVFFFLLLALGNHGYTYPYRSLWGILLMLNCCQNKSTRENNRYGKIAPSCQTGRLKTKPLIKTRKALF